MPGGLIEFLLVPRDDGQKVRRVHHARQLVRGSENLPCLLDEMSGGSQAVLLVRDVRRLNERLRRPFVLANVAFERNGFAKFFQRQVKVTALGIQRRFIPEDSRAHPSAKKLENVKITSLWQVIGYLERLFALCERGLQVSFFLANFGEIHQSHRLRHSVERNLHVARLSL